ncbi:MAG: aminodeoxychorismate synthase component I [Gallionella sp.]
MSPYCAELPYHSNGAKYYAALSDLPWAVWLDSCGMARYDILSASPQCTVMIDHNEQQRDPFDMLRDQLGELLAPLPNVPFSGGALGYWSYDLSRQMMGLPAISSAVALLPKMAIGLYDWALVIDHLRRTAKLLSRQRYADTADLLPEILRRLRGRKAPQNPGNFAVRGQITSNFTPASYAAAFSKVQEYLRSGDCYQINLAQKFKAQASGDAFSAYLKLRQLSRAPYSAFLQLPQLQILCNSPERFVSVLGDRVETRPIKGTRPRSPVAARDQELARDLLNHHKDRAENLMIVDLLRNDLGKVCKTGSVRTPRLFEVESYANVHHLVSTVEGRLASTLDSLDVLRACFPGGSVTGAPKRRAMQIIDQLEPDPRGVYCGAIGYVGFDGNMDTNIGIRTMVHFGNEIACWAGGGIVADSTEQSEYQETLDKASVMLELMQQCGGEYEGVPRRHGSQ